jgi:predicted RNA-binding Zn-ribbon protein involved in translation (DUF1610 family)
VGLKGKTMTTKEALQELQNGENAIFAGSNVDIRVSIDALNTAITALQKQMPKKPLIVDEDYNYFECPYCNHAIFSTSDLTDHKNCLNCGQALDWGDMT